MATKTITITFKKAKSFTTGRTIDGKPAEIQNIVLHSSDGREAGDIATLTGNKVSSNYYVTRAGKVFQFVKDKDTAFHAGAVFKPKFFSNAATLGIEQEHFDPDIKAGRPKNENWPDAQIKAVAELVAFLCQEHGLDETDDIKTHAQIARPAGRKQDPFGYPMAALVAQVTANRAHTWKVSIV